MSTTNPAKITLKPLIVSCLPESGRLISPAGLCTGSLFVRPDIAISYSAQERGWLRVLANDFRVFCQTDCENLTLRLNSYDLLIAAPLSLNTLAKFALGIRDSFPAELLWQFSCLGKPILLAEDCLPDEKQAMNPHLARIYRQHWQTVVGGTVAGFNADNLSEKVQKLIRAKMVASRQPISSERVFITRDDVIVAAESLEPMRVPANAIITDMAREEASARGVIIIQA